MRAWSVGAILAMTASSMTACSSVDSSDRSEQAATRDPTRVVTPPSRLPSQTCVADCAVTRFELRSEMRRRWTEHVAWTRFFSIDAMVASPELPRTADRLVATASDLAETFRPFVGDAMANEIAAHLRDQIAGTALVLLAAKSGDPAKLDAAKSVWLTNGDLVARVLAGASGASFEDMRAKVRDILERTLAELTARLAGDWAADAAAYDAVVDAALGIADVLARGVADSRPDLVGADVLPREDLRLAMRKLWEDEVTWERVVVVDALAKGDGLPDEPFAVDRLAANAKRFGDLVRPFYGADASRLEALLRDHARILADVAFALKRDDAAFSEAKARLVANGDLVASLFAAETPSLEAVDVKAIFRAHVDRTVAQIADRVAGKGDDVADWDQAEQQALEIADMLSAGIALRFRP